MATMDLRKKLRVKPGSKVKLARISTIGDADQWSRDDAKAEIAQNVARMDELQYKLFADGRRSLLIVVQALDAGGKDGVIRNVFRGMNPQGTSVASFKQPSAQELAHDFLWRVHQHAPAKGEVAVFNRSHYEDVLIVRVHKLVKKSVWAKRYALINDFERLLAENGTAILKFYLHISPEEQLQRFRDRLEDAERNWKISEADYTERDLWPHYREAYEDALEKTSTEEAPRVVSPADRKWFRDLAVSRIIADSMDDMGLRVPQPRVDLDAVRRKYHAEVKELRDRGSLPSRRRRER